MGHPSQGRLRRLRARRRRLPRLDDRRRPPLHHAAQPAQGQHDAARSTRGGSPTSSRCASSTARELRELGRLALSDAPAPRRARLPAHLAGTRRSTSPPSRIRATTPDRIALLPHRARHHQRGLLRRPRRWRASWARTTSTTPRGSATRRRPGRSRRASAWPRRPAPTRDVIESDLIVLFGSDVANAQPVFMKYLYMARKRGARGRRREPVSRARPRALLGAVERRESAIFGTKIADEFFPVHVGGDIAFLNGVLKVLIEDGGVDRRLRARAHRGLRGAARGSSSDESLDDLARFSGLERRTTSGASHGSTRRRRSAVLVWSMGITQHVCGTDNVQAIVNLALARGNVGRPGAGLMPIRGHSGVQGGAEMGCLRDRVPRRRADHREVRGGPASAQYGFPIRARRAASPRPRWSRPPGAARWTCSGPAAATSWTRCPTRSRATRALERVPLRVHQDIVVSSQMLVDAARTCCCCRPRPATSRRAAAPRPRPSGGSPSPGDPAPEVGEARSEWQHLPDLARARSIRARADLARLRRRPGRSARRSRGSFPSTTASSTWPRRRRDPVGRRAPLRRLELPDGRRQGALQRGRAARDRSCRPAGFAALDPTREAVQLDGLEAEGPADRRTARRPVHLREPTRAARAWRGAASRRSDRHGRDRGARAHQPTSAPGNVQMFFPEANPLICAGRRDPVALVPDYNAVVEVEPIDGRQRVPVDAPQPSSQRSRAMASPIDGSSFTPPASGDRARRRSLPPLRPRQAGRADVRRPAAAPRDPARRRGRNGDRASCRRPVAPCQRHRRTCRFPFVGPSTRSCTRDRWSVCWPAPRPPTSGSSSSWAVTCRRSNPPSCA